MKRVISVLLAMLMLLSLSAAAFADNGSGVEMKYKSYEKYLAIGDSITRACGLDPTEDIYYDDVWNNENGIGNNYPGSVPALVANAINPEKNNADANFQYMGMRSLEGLYGLGGDIDIWNIDRFTPEEFGDEHITNNGGIDMYTEQFQQNASDADLITLQLGFNDIFYCPLQLSGLRHAFSAGGDELVSALAEDLKLTAEGLAKFMEYYPKLVERIFELQAQAGRTADDFDLVVVGVYNPFANAPVTEDIFIPAMELLDVVTGTMNAFIKDVAAKYDNVYYADIADAQTPVTSGAMNVIDSFTTGNSNVNTHPTAEGYKYIARQILNALPQEAVYPNTYVQLNLGTNFTVSKVLLDGKSVSFTQDGYNLVVSNASKLHATMTVMGKDASGHSLLFFYQLAYHRDTGYVCYRIASTNDISMTISRIFTTTKMITQTLFDGIASLFTNK